MTNCKVQKFTCVVAIMVFACVAISHCNNKYHDYSNHQHPQPCCADNNCIRIRYNSYADNYDWYGGCCMRLDSRYSHCRSNPDGYLTVQAFCDYRYDCYKRSNMSDVENEKPVSLIKVNQTMLEP